jgi:DNA-3-methyladenine glycosylase II
VHVVGLSILSGSHVSLVRDVMNGLKAHGLHHVPVIVGGIIPEEDGHVLKQLGVARIYTPKDYRLTDIMADVVTLVDDARLGAGRKRCGVRVVDQQISLAAGAAIWRRLEAQLAPFEAARLLAASDETLRACGLSGGKIRTLRAIAAAAADGSLDFARVETLPDEAASAMLTAVHGIGPWTAEIYLLTCLGRPDVWPAGDLALQAAAGAAFDLAGRPTAAQLRELGEPWRPWRAVAARLLWGALPPDERPACGITALHRPAPPDIVGASDRPLAAL